MGKEKFLSEMFGCVASKVGLEPLVSRAGCEWTGTECCLTRPRLTPTKPNLDKVHGALNRPMNYATGTV